MHSTLTAEEIASALRRLIGERPDLAEVDLDEEDRAALDTLRDLVDPMCEFDPYRSFASVEEALDYCAKYPYPLTATRAVVSANMARCEFGFAAELCRASESLVCYS